MRADRQLARVFHRGQLVKVHPRQHPRGRSTDPADLPSHATVYAMRDLDRLRRMATGHGRAVGAYATALWDILLPWTKMRQVYALLGLVRKVRNGRPGSGRTPGQPLEPDRGPLRQSMHAALSEHRTGDPDVVA